MAFRNYFHVKWSVVDQSGNYRNDRYTLCRVLPWQSLVVRLGKQMIEYREQNGYDIVPIEVKRV